MFILDDLLIKLPAKGLGSIFMKVYEMAQAELTDNAKIKEELQLLQTLYEIDQITDEEYQHKEAELLERLAVAEEASLIPVGNAS
jgi:Gas vesicle protein G